MTEEEISFYKEWKDYMVTRISIEYFEIGKNDFISE